MDKRYLLFIVCLSLAFFGVQTWFGAKNPSPQAFSQSEELSRSEPLPFVDLFLDSQGEKKLATALACASHYFTLFSNDSLPSIAYVRSGDAWEEVTLRGFDGTSQENAPAVYSKKSAEPLFLPPLDMSAHLQLFSPAAPHRMIQGKPREDRFYPNISLKGAAIALFKEHGTYFPVGIYDGVSQRIKALHAFDRLKEVVVQSELVSLSPAPSDEEFYVLENEYQQLVFSTLGGSLAEINLPLHSPKDPKSLVKEIDIDREILAQSPQNSRFPLYPHFRNLEGKTELVREGSLGGYYPLLRRSQLSHDGQPKHIASPEYYALSLLSDQVDLSQLNYRVTRFEKNIIQFRASSGGRTFTKTFTLPATRNGPYCFDVEIEVDGQANDLWLSSGVPDVEIVGGSYAPLLRYQITQGANSEVETIDLPKSALAISSPSPNWISNSNGFLGLILDPISPVGKGYKTSIVSGTALPSRLSLIDAAYQLYPAEKYPGYLTYLPLKEGENIFRTFAGPFDDALLKDLDALYDEPLKNYNPDYASAQSIQGWFSFISRPFAKFLFLLMQLFHSIFRSWAVSIIFLTIALRAMMYPLNTWSIRSTLKMQEIAPKIKALQEKYKKDKGRAQMEIVKLYKESGVNPFMGCLPMFLQMPFLFGMFYLLKSSFPLRGAMFIPGWIDDLAAPDVLFSWKQPLWFIGNELHLLPILMGVTMFIQQKMSQASKEPSPANSGEISDAQKQQKMMGNLMAVLFTVMFYSFPSGLNIYFMFSTLLGIVQQWWIMKTMRTKKLEKTA